MVYHNRIKFYLTSKKALAAAIYVDIAYTSYESQFISVYTLLWHPNPSRLVMAMLLSEQHAKTLQPGDTESIRSSLSYTTRPPASSPRPVS
jgi:hypothetical protein